MRLAVLIPVMSVYAVAQCLATASAPAVKPFVPPAPYTTIAARDGVFYGSENLWTYIPRKNFAVSGPDYISAKLTYWRVGFDSDNEPEPELAVVARRLDAPASLVWANKAHGIKVSGSNAPWDLAMMTGISFPTSGCWEISSNYKGQILTYIVNVTVQVPLRDRTRGLGR